MRNFLLQTRYPAGRRTPDQAHHSPAMNLDAMNPHDDQTGRHCTATSLHRDHPQHFGCKPAQWPQTKRIGHQTFSLLLPACMTAADRERVLGGAIQVLS